MAKVFVGCLSISFEVVYRDTLQMVEGTDTDYAFDYSFPELPKHLRRVWTIEDTEDKVVSTHNSLKAAIASLKPTAKTLGLTAALQPWIEEIVDKITEQENRKD